MTFFAQPDFTNQKVEIFGVPTGAPVNGNPVATLLFEANEHPNAVVLYRDEAAGTWHMFVSFAYRNPGDFQGVKAYDFAAAYLTGNHQLQAASSLNLGIDCLGMAIQPGTGDLFIACLGQIAIYPHANYTTNNPVALAFATHAALPGALPDVCANLAFDRHGYLWMSAFNWVVCFTNSVVGGSGQFVKIDNVQNLSPKHTLQPSIDPPQGSQFYPFSQPEGIAFDPDGNLWVANNNEDAGSPNNQGDTTLLKIGREWIDTTLRTGVAQPLSDIDATVHYMAGAKFGGLAFDGYTLYLHDQGDTDADHRRTWKFNTLAVPAAGPLGPPIFQPSGIPTTYPGNGSGTFIDPDPVKLLIGDSPADVGGEPDIAAYQLWESHDIGVSNTQVAIPPVMDFLDVVTPNAEAFGYVRVRNIGTKATTGNEVIRLHWATASTGLTWPAPWDSLAALPLGGIIGTQLLGVIAPGDEKFFEFHWDKTPDPNLYGGNAHFCLVARIESAQVYPFGATHPEKWANANLDLSDNVQNNRMMAWRNIAVASANLAPDAPGRHVHDLTVLGANPTGQPHTFRFAVEAQHNDGHRDHSGRVVIHATNRSLDHLLAAKHAGALEPLGHGKFLLLRPSEGIANIELAPGELFPFRVEYDGGTGHDFVLRALQYVHTGGHDRLMGGQTLVVGKPKWFGRLR